MSNMDIPKVENLQIGQEIKNYEELCEILEIEKKSGGKVKKIQLEKLSKVIEYHKKGHKFVIDKINKVDEIELIDKRKLGNRSVTSIEIGDLILQKLLTEYKGREISITNNELLFRLMIVSEEYRMFLYDTGVFKFEVGINGKYLRDYRLKLGNQLSKRIESALKRLKSSGYIMYDKKIHLRFMKEVDGKKYYYVTALDEEKDKKNFIDARLKAFEKLNKLRKEENKPLIQDMSVVFIHGELKRFKDLVCKELSCVYKDKCVNFWEGYIITTTSLALNDIVDNERYNKNLEFVRKNFYELLEHTTKDIKDKELETLRYLYEEAYEQENKEVSWGIPIRFESYKIKSEIKSINNLSKMFIK
ncbi:hypothetical protein TPELB_35670 [Terrisporobacter petrolearius]|uniref:Replication initiator protein A n=1 Tax=Terrisporobacter petrolearius TaxID=1460447 RepID=A0ABZ3FHD7_9FIRM